MVMCVEVLHTASSMQHNCEKTNFALINVWRNCLTQNNIKPACIAKFEMYNSVVVVFTVQTDIQLVSPG